MVVATSPSRCLNCGEALHGAFCSQCGQRVVPPHPTVRELAGDAYGELVGWDGKFAATLRALLTKPGELTRGFLEGRRVRYLPPVKLYLMCSVVYFVAAAMVPLPVDNNGNLEFDVSVGVGTGTQGQSPEEAAFVRAIGSGLNAVSTDDRLAAEQFISEQPRILQPIMRAMARDFGALQRRSLEILPRVLFLLVPALAAILALLYRGRPYPDHLYFALQLQTFAFVVLALSKPFQYSASLWLAGGAQIAAAVWILVYAILAQRRVYGGTWLRTLLKSVCAATLYGILWGTVTLTVTLWVSREI